MKTKKKTTKFCIAANVFKELKLTITHLSWHFSQFDSYLTSKFAYISILYKYQPSLSSFSPWTCQHCPLHCELFSWNPSNFFYSSRALFETTSYSFGHHQISVLWLLWEEKKKIVICIQVQNILKP